MSRPARWLLAAPLVLVGCSSPGDVEQRYARRMGEAQEDLIRAQQGVDDARRGYESDLASAREWDVHVLGIPASGWVFLLIVAGIVVSILAAWAIYQFRQTTDDRRVARDNREKRANQLLVEKERTRQAELAAQKAEFDSVQRYVPPKLSSEAGPDVQ